MTTQKQIDKKIEEMKSEITALEREKREIQKNSLLTCMHCSTKSQIKKWTLLYKFHYVPPSGCMDGDYWVRQTDEFFIQCPHCKNVFRVYDVKTGDKKCLMARVFNKVNECQKEFGEILYYYYRYGEGLDVDKIREEYKRSNQLYMW